MNVGNPDFCPEEYLFRKLAENFDYIKNKNVKVQVALSTSWSEELRKNNYNYTVGWVRKWIADMMRILRQGTIPEFAQTEELLPIAQEMIFKSDNLHRHAVGTHVISAPYSEVEQDHILTRIAERADELKAKTKGSKIRFVREVVAELQMKGFNRSNRSVGIWVKNVLKGKFPSILKQPRMSIIKDILAKTFGQKHVDFDQAEKHEEQDIKQMMASQDKFVLKMEESEQDAQLVPSSPEEISDSYTNTSTDGSTMKTTSEPMDLRTLLEISEQSVETVVINCNPFMEDLVSPPLGIDFSDGNVLKRYEEKKTALQTARKRKRAAEREVDEIREQLRVADAKVAVESKKIHFLEEELEELKEYLEDSNA